MIAGTLEIELIANLANLQNSMNQANQIVGNTMTGIERAVGLAKAALAGLAAGLSVGAFVGLIQGAIEAKAGLQDLSEKTGSTVESLSALKSVAKLSETSMDGIADAINKVSRSMVAAKNPASDSAEAFRSIGISAKEIAENMDDPAKMMLVLAQHLDKVKEGAGKTDVQIKIMGKSAAALSPFLKDLADKNELVAKATAESAEAADEFGKIMVQLKGQWNGVYSVIADQLLPVLNEFFSSLLKGGGIAKTVTAFVKELADQGKIREWAEGAKSAIDSLATAIKPAIAVGTAYLAIFIAAPAVFTAASTALMVVYGAVGRVVVGMIAGQASTFSFNNVLFGTSVAAQLAAGSLTKMMLAGNVLFAAFAGWQIGTWLRENFVEARIAGLVFIAVMLKGWENLKYGAEMAWEGIKFAWEKSISAMKGLFAEYLSDVAQGLGAIGANNVAAQVAGYAEELRKAAASQKTFVEQTAGITAAHQQAISAIDDDIVSTIAWEQAQSDAAKAGKSVADAFKEKKIEVKESTALSAEAIAAAKKELDAYNSLISAIKAKTEENRLELLVGENATESQKELIKLEQQLATGKLILTAAHIAAVKAAIQEQAATEAMLKTRNSEKATLDWIIASTKARLASRDALANEYAMYGKSNEEKEIALIALKAEADLQEELEKRRKAQIPVTEEMLGQMKREMEMRVTMDQARMRESKALGFAEQLAVENKRFAAEAIFDEKQRATAILAIDADVWRKRVDAAGEGTEAQKKLQEEFVTWYGNQLMKPEIDAQRKIWASIEETAHDTFVNVLDSGKNAFDRLRDTLKNGLWDLLYQMTLKKWIMNIGAAVTGGTLGAAANAATGGLVGGADGASNGLGTLGTIAQMGSSLVSTLTGGMQVAFQKFAFSSMGSTLGLSAATPMTTGGIMGTGSMVLPGTPALTTLGSIGSGIAAAAPYIAAAVLLYQGLQMGEKQMTGQTVTGTVGGNNASNDLYRNVSWSQSGGFLRGDRSGTWSYNLANSTAMADGKPYVDSASLTADKALLGALTDSYDLLKKASADYAKALGLNADDINSRTDEISFAVGKDAAETQSNISKMFEDIGNKIATDLLTPFATLAKSGESASQTLTRLAANITGVNDAMTVLGYQTYKLDESGVKAANALVELFGGLQNLQTVTSAYYDKYYSDAEKASVVTKNIGDEFKKVGYVLPESMAQLRAWIEAAKALNTEAGDKTYVSLMQLAGAFAELTDITGGVNTAAKQKADELAASKSDYIIKIMEAQGLGQQALNMQRQKEIMLLNDELRPLAEKLELALREKEARELATRQAGLAVEILRLEGKEVEATALQRKLELAAMEEGLKPQQLRIYALQDEAKQLDIIKAHRSLDIELMRALGNEEGALAAERADALKGMDKYSQDVTKQIWAANAANEAIAKAKAASEAEAQRQQQVKEEQERAAQQAMQDAKQAYDQLISQDRADLQEAYNAESAALQDVISKMGGFAQAARKLQDSLRYGADSPLTRAQKFSMAQTGLPDVIASANRGDASSVEKLQQYVELLKASASSSREYVVGVSKVISILDGSADIAETQEAIAKNQLSALKKTVDALLNVDKSVKTVGEAIAKLNADQLNGLNTVAAAVYGQYQANNKASTTSPVKTTAANTQAIIDAGPKQAVIADVYARYREAEKAYGLMVVEAQKKGFSGTEFDYSQMFGGRFDLQAELDKAMQAAGFAMKGVPAFDIGTNYVPHDMLAMIHEGEAVVPKAYNPAAYGTASSGSGQNAELYEKLMKEVEGLRKEARATATNTEIMARLFRRVTPQGDAIATREVPA